MYIEHFLIGTAWLSSVRVVKCCINLYNGRNLYYKFLIKFLFQKLSFYENNRLRKLNFIFFDKR